MIIVIIIQQIERKVYKLTVRAYILNNNDYRNVFSLSQPIDVGRHFGMVLETHSYNYDVQEWLGGIHTM